MGVGLEKPAGQPRAAARLGWIDAVKGFTIILVVAHHALLGLEAADIASPAIVYWHEILLTVRMPLFFLVAGLFARKAIEGDLRPFLDGKILHFAYFYILWSLILFGIRYAANSIALNQISLIEILYIAWDPISTIWFLYALALAFAITRALRWLDPTILVALAASVQAASFVFPDVPFFVIVNKFDYLYLYFVLGVYGSEWIRSRAAQATYGKAAIAAVAFLALAIPLRQADLLMMPLSYLVLSIISAYAIISFLSRGAGTGIGRSLAWIGQFSMPIYLTHFLPVAGVRVVLTRLGLENFWLLYAACVAFSVVFGIVAYMAATRSFASFLFIRPKFFRLKEPGAPALRPKAELPI